MIITIMPSYGDMEVEVIDTEKWSSVKEYLEKEEELVKNNNNGEYPKSYETYEDNWSGWEDLDKAVNNNSFIEYAEYLTKHQDYCDYQIKDKEK